MYLVASVCLYVHPYVHLHVDIRGSALLTLRKKVEPKQLHPWSRFMVRNSALFSKTAPRWSRFGSTFFLSVVQQRAIRVITSLQSFSVISGCVRMCADAVDRLLIFDEYGRSEL